MKEYPQHIEDEIKEQIKKEVKPYDYEGYVYNCLLFDNGFTGAIHYDISISLFYQICLNALSNLLEQEK